MLNVGSWMLDVAAAAGLGKLAHGELSVALHNFQLNDFTKLGDCGPRWHALNILRHLNAFHKFSVATRDKLQSPESVQPVSFFRLNPLLLLFDHTDIFWLG